MTPEGRIKAHLNKRLRELKYCYRFMPVQNGMGAAAVDYFLCIGGLFVAIETKAPGRVPTPRQNAVLAAVTEAGGVSYWVDSVQAVDEVMEILKRDYHSC